MRNLLVAVGSCVAMLFNVAGCSQQNVSGRELYAANCATCHGRYADGQGPAAPDLSGGTAPDLRYLAVRNDGTFPREWVAKVIDGREIVTAHRDRQMPVWGAAFAANGSSKAQTELKINALVDYLAEIQQQP